MRNPTCYSSRIEFFHGYLVVDAKEVAVVLATRRHDVAPIVLCEKGSRVVLDVGSGLCYEGPLLWTELRR